MTKPFTLTALGFAVLALCACKQSPAPLPSPATSALPSSLPAGAEVPARSGTDASVPAATSVMTPATQASGPDAASGRSNKAMTKTEESTAMPLPGQANDHSAPTPPARRASGS